MRHGFRRSFGSKAFRVNVSRSGVGFSTGVKGFRVSTNSRGTFVNIGLNGVRYRQRIGAPGASAHRGGFTPPAYQQPTGYQHIPTASVDSLVDQRSEQLLKDINEIVAQPSAIPKLLPFAIILSLATVLANPYIPVFAGVVCAIGLFIIHAAEVKARQYSLLFELDTAAEQQWQAICSALTGVQIAHRIWRIAAHTQTADWKHNAGATILTSRTLVSLSRGQAPSLATNIDAYILDAGDQKLCFLPDRLYIFQAGRYGAVEYDRLSVSVQNEEFIESGGVPADARVVRSVWQHPNKDGGPDRRFSANYQIPVVLYGKVILTSSSGLNIHLQVSSLSAADAFGRLRPQVRTGPNQQHTTTGYSHQQTASAQPKAIPKCYITLGLRVGCSKDDAISAYRALVKRYHPDILSNLSPELALIAEERMKEINVAMEDLKKLNSW